MGRTQVVVKCQGLVHIKSRTGACGKVYACLKRAYSLRLNKCPDCGSSKAAWQGPQPRIEQPPPLPEEED